MVESNKRVSLVYVTTLPVTQWVFLRGQNRYMSQKGFDIHAIASPGPFLEEVGKRDGVTTHEVGISRAISPFSDLASLVQLYLTLKRIHPHIVHLSTPKAALLGAIAAWIARVPNRVFFIRGLVTENAQGFKRFIYRQLEKLTAKLCHQHICVSHSLLEFARSESILASNQGVVVANGMSNGIDVIRFDPSVPAGSDSFPTSLIFQSVGPIELVIGFVGRLAHDKGVEDLALAWSLLREEYPGTALLLVGPWDDAAPILASIRAALENDPRVHITGFVEDVVSYYRTMSLFVYPSHGTEGFPNAPMEAAAMELPVVATQVMGCVDAVLDGVTGMLVPPRDVEALADAIRLYINDPVLRRKHGQAGRERVLREFQQEPIWEALHQEYMRLLQEKKVLSRGEASGVGLTHVIKRLIDIVGTLMGLLAFGLLMLIIAVAVLLTIGPPILFRQQRAGLHGRPFTLLKFRTMTDARDERGNLLPDAQRLTRLGRFLRSTSLDELPTLVNVLRGAMSLVGPRPLVMAYLGRYAPEQARRHEVKPGITGWAQVNGRNALTWEEKFALDVWYVDHWSLWLDLKIIALTVWKVLKREGINQPGQATMEEFMGSSGR